MHAHTHIIIGEPSYVNLAFEESILIHTTVECTAIGGESPELFNLTLWRNDELLAQINGDCLTYTTSPGSYGTYTCNVDGVQNSSVLQERGKHNINIRFIHKVFYFVFTVKFQLLLNGVNITQCHQLMVNIVYVICRLSCVGLAPLPCSL